MPNPICSHIKDDGQPCNALPVKGSSYCYFHRQYHQPTALPGDRNYQPPLFESHASIQIAVTHLYQAFAAKKIDLREANFLLHILRLASKTILAIEKAHKEEKKQSDGEKERNGRRSPSTGQSELSSTVKMGERPTSPVQAEPGSATPLPAAQPKRGTWDPYGCMPKNNGHK